MRQDGRLLEALVIGGWMPVRVANSVAAGQSPPMHGSWVEPDSMLPLSIKVATKVTDRPSA